MTVATKNNAEKARRASQETGRRDYKRSVRSSVRGLWRSEISTFDFITSMSIAIRNNFTRAWHEGAMQCGIRPDDLTVDELSRLEQEIVTEQGYIIKLANHVLVNDKIRGGRLRDAAQNVDLWLNRMENIRNIAMGYACGDKKLKWVRGRTLKPCKDCVMLNNRVYRASVWRSAGWEPRSRDLECGGYKCLCRFEVTDEPATPGLPPRRF